MKIRLINVSLCLVLGFGMVSTAAFAALGGSIGQGDFSVMKGEQLVDKLSGQNPLKDESMLVCDGKCMIKSEGISLVAADQAKFAIKNESDTFRLFLREGSVDYVITDKARKIAFHTPEGVYSVAEIVFNAASNPVVRGTVQVNADGKTEISVKEGRLVFATADGMKAVGVNEKIVLAAIGDTLGAGASSGVFTPGVFVAGGLVLAGGTTMALMQPDNDNPAPNSPPPAAVTPTPTPRPAPTPSPSI
ncbi:MAG: hypothetical protein PHZ02_09735 [Desulfocapsaceae bacterium]|nr:hypothetical protein [Desulfocapsaceae bacterium]